MPSATSKTTTTRAPRKRTAPTTSEVPTDDSVNDKYAPRSWGAAQGEFYTDLEVPSGQLCLARRPGLEGLLKVGIVNNFDTLTKMIGQQAGKVKGKPAKSDDQLMKDLLADPSKIDELMHVINKIVCYVVVKPSVTYPPNDPTSRKNDVVYADMIDLEDRMFIMNWALGGVRDLERFREQHEAALGSLGDQPEAEDQAE